VLGVILLSPVFTGCKSKAVVINPSDLNQTQPVYPGGTDSLLMYVARHIEFTPYMNEIDATGKILIRFIVEKDGRITNPEIQRSLEKYYDEAAIKSLMSAPRFIKPAFHSGVPVRSYYVIPVKIMLE
jgi:Gram-negative bacterial tonB protein.